MSEPSDNQKIDIMSGLAGRIPNEMMDVMRDFLHMVDVMAHSGTVLLNYTPEAEEFVKSFKPKMPGDAGVDMYTITDMTILPGQYVDVPSGIKLAMPFDWYAEIRARSSTSKRRIYVAPGIIDAGYRGELYACCVNLTNEPIVIKRGERVAQVVFHRRIHPNFKIVNELPPSERGDKGFGATGT